jgi:hypothetical protein
LLFCSFLFLHNFDFDIQMNSNQFLKFSKIQNINTKQKGAVFHDKTNFPNILYVWPIWLYLHIPK